MAKIPLVQGAYTASSVIANAQRCVNLYPEKNTPDSPFPYTHYPRPGYTLLSMPPAAGLGRGLYTDSQGNLYGVVANTVYKISPSWVWTQLGTVASAVGKINMTDNGLAVVIVDGSATGYAINMSTFAMAAIGDGNFLGANICDYIDTFLVFVNQTTGQFFSSLSNVTYANLIAGGSGSAFNSLWVAKKTGEADFVCSVFCIHREIWLIGTRSTEVWFDAGNAGLPFAEMPGAFIEHGTIATNSPASADVAVYWLSKDKQGTAMVLRGEGYAAKRVSTHALEQILSSYTTLSDAIGYTYLENGHVFYVLTFPTANATWALDISTGFWSQRAFVDINGNLNRDRGQVSAFAYGKNLVIDWQNGNLYQIDNANNTDWYDGSGPNADGSYPISYVRSWPTFVEEGKRIRFDRFVADMEVGDDTGVLDGSSQTSPPQVTLRYSDDGGKTWGEGMQQSLGALGQYNNSVQWRRLGLGRRRVFELSWSCPTKTALNGAYVDMTPGGS